MKKKLAAAALAVATVAVVVTAADQVRLRIVTRDTAGPQPPVNGCPDGSVTISTSQDPQTVVDGQAAGTAYCFLAGTHRQRTITPKNGDSFTAESGVILSGAKLLTSPTQDGAVWYYTGQTQADGSHVGTCHPSYVMCQYPEDLWIDGVLKVRSTQLAGVTTNTWFLDYAADRIYIGDDPTGKTVETSTNANAAAFTGSASTVTIEDLVIEKYAAPAQAGAIDAEDATGWIVQQNTIRYNHGIGIRCGASIQLLNNVVQNNYQMGIGGECDNGLVSGNEIASNNVQFDFGWEGGGTKFTNSDSLILRNNIVHDNLGPGLWLDINNDKYLIEGNTVTDNASGGFNASSAGIFIEISGGGVIRNNTVTGNGDGWTLDNWLFGAGILIAASGRAAAVTVPDYGSVTGILVTGNTVTNNSDGIGLIQQERDGEGFDPPWGGSHWVENVTVTSNTVRIPVGGLNGGVQDEGSTAIFDSRNNTFESNTYTRPNTCAGGFAWSDGERTFAEWQGYGHDTPVGSCTVN